MLTFCSKETEYKVQNPQTTYSSVELHLDSKLDDKFGKPLGTHYTSSGEPFTGTQKSYYSNTDSLHMKQLFEDGIQTEAVIYYDDGDIVRQKHGVYLNKPHLKKMYKNGILVYENVPPTQSKDGMGHVRLWHKNGQLSVEHSYTGDQVKQGLLTEYDEEGNITMQERYEDGELVETIK
jgi:antitoxin component YwqK of YwqJK toxin-antitoxin module